MVERSFANPPAGTPAAFSRASPAFQEVLGELDRAWTGV